MLKDVVAPDAIHLHRRLKQRRLKNQMSKDSVPDRGNHNCGWLA